MKWLMRWVRTILVTSCLLISGCLGNYGLSDFATTGGAIVGTGAGLALGLPPLQTVAATAAGATVGAIAVADTEETTSDVLDKLPEDERAAALASISKWETLESWGYWIIGGLFLWFFVPMIIGYFIPRRSEVRMKKRLFDDPNVKMKDL